MPILLWNTLVTQLTAFYEDLYRYYACYVLLILEIDEIRVNWMGLHAFLNVYFLMIFISK